MKIKKKKKTVFIGITLTFILVGWFRNITFSIQSTRTFRNSIIDGVSTQNTLDINVLDVQALARNTTQAVKESDAVFIDSGAFQQTITSSTARAETEAKKEVEEEPAGTAKDNAEAKETGKTTAKKKAEGEAVTKAEFNAKKKVEEEAGNKTKVDAKVKVVTETEVNKRAMGLPLSPSPITNTMNIILFITTHLSDQHIQYFDCCWPRLMERSKLLPKIDVMIYTNNQIHHYNRNVTNRITSLFKYNPNVYYKHDNTNITRRQGLQRGANLPLELALREGWFSKYDWVIRINPDVLIRNSTWLVDTMLTMEGQQQIDGIFVKCTNRPKLHTDFFAFRPNFDDPRLKQEPEGRINNTTSPYIPFGELINGNHEQTATTYFQPILDSKRYKLVPDVARSNGICRVRGKNSSIYHAHDSCKVQPSVEPSSNGLGYGNRICDALEGWDIS